jgi:hypothetical protein
MAQESDLLAMLVFVAYFVDEAEWSKLTDHPGGNCG